MTIPIDRDSHNALSFTVFNDSDENFTHYFPLPTTVEQGVVEAEALLKFFREVKARPDSLLVQLSID